MALGLKLLIQQDITGRSIWLTDKTGTYDVTTNPTGWGVENLAEQDQSALVFHVIRNAEAGAEDVSAVSVDAYHNNLAADDDEATVEFNYLMDGWHTLTFFRLPVSDTGVNTIDTTPVALSEGDYFYYTGGSNANQVHKKVGSNNVLVTDYSEMIGNGDIVQVTCEAIFYNKIAIKANDKYKEYRDERDKRGRDSKNAVKLLHDVLDLREDIRGADYAFRSGLTTQAQDIIETTIDEYDIT